MVPHRVLWRYDLAALALTLILALGMSLARLPQAVDAGEASALHLPLVLNQATPTFTPTPTATATPTASPTPTETPGWREEYYNNTSLAGAPQVVRTGQPYIFPQYEWGEGAPVPGLSHDNFSVRFSARPYFAAGEYEFWVTADDGFRLYIDLDGYPGTPPVLVLDKWYGSYRGPDLGGTSSWRWRGYISEGAHEVRLEYYEASGEARVRCFWLTDDLSAHWRAEYYANETLSGAPVLVRNEDSIDYNWEYGSPGPGVPADGFSVRWTRAFWIPEGQYVMYTTADDGVRVLVDRWADTAWKVIDDWGGGPSRSKSAPCYLGGDAQPGGGRGAWFIITVLYHEGNSLAECRYKYLYGGIKDKFVGEYYNFIPSNPDDPASWGTPYRVRIDNAINFDWGWEAPMSDMPANNFAVRWLTCRYFEPGAYHFTATIDDGCRVWVDDNLIINEWVGGAARDRSGDIILFAGWHVVRMEYYEAINQAVAKLRWSQTEAVQLWRADFWNGIQKGGEENGDYTTYLSDLSLDCGTGSPAPGISPDNWSARFKQFVYFDHDGYYQFKLEYNGGASLYFANEERIDKWNDRGWHTEYWPSNNPIWITAGHYWVKVHYADYGVGERGFVRLTIIGR